MIKDGKQKSPPIVSPEWSTSERRLRPISLEKQWEQIAKWHEFLVSDQAKRYPIPNALAEAWDAMDQPTMLERGAELNRIARTPLAVLFFFIELGFYPPPELLFTLLDVWDSYIANGGRLTLEEAFLGPPRRRAGNHAARSASRFRKILLVNDMTDLVRQGMTRVQAAERIVEKWHQRGIKLDVETIVRTIKPFKAKRPEK